MTHKSYTLILALLALGTSQCSGYAKHVEIRPEKGGVVALPYGQSEKSRAKAEALMEDTCDGPYEVTKEKSVVVGETHRTETRDQNDSHTERDKHGKSRYSDGRSVTTTTIQQQTEWRIYYKCVY